MSRNLYILFGLVAGSLILTGCSKSKTGTPILRVGQKQGVLEGAKVAVKAAVPQALGDTRPLQYEFEYDGRAYFSLAGNETVARAIQKADPQKDENGRSFHCEFEYDGSVYISYPEV